MQDKLKVIKLYLENCGIRTIERLTGINNRLISLWIIGAADEIKREFEHRCQNMKSIKDIAIIEVDELYI